MLPVLPPDVIRLRYQSLCEVQLLHRYFLNVGNTPFEQEPPDASVLAARRDYDARSFWRLVPSPATAELLRRRHLLLQATAEGLRVAGPQPAPRPSPPDPIKLRPHRRPPPTSTLPPPPILALTFWAYPTDPRWTLYTELPPEQGPIWRSDLVLPDEGPFDKLRLLPPDVLAPAGRVLVLTAPASPVLPLPASGLEPLDLTLEPWPGTEAAPRPVAVLRLLLTEGAAPRRLAYVLGNRSTRWEHNTQVRGPLPLVRHGRLDAGFVDDKGRPLDLPNPTPATTEARPDGYYSRVY